MRLGALSRRHCETCKDETLHNRALCTHCGADNASSYFDDFQRKRVIKLIKNGFDSKIAGAMINAHKRAHSDARRAEAKSWPLRDAGPRKRASIFGKRERTKA